MENYIKLKKKELTAAQRSLAALDPETRAFRDTKERIGYLMFDINAMRREQKK